MILVSAQIGQNRSDSRKIKIGILFCKYGYKAPVRICSSKRFEEKKPYKKREGRFHKIEYHFKFFAKMESAWIFDITIETCLGLLLSAVVIFKKCSEKLG